ncbi:hypothetical protein EVAR_60375_1 [Eumeta japonica]|uniref:Uncharacterized protein n=1 Tax=Eumeta variegata TaxID=151549 RepID=A0A4C1ZL11_EUMVA|nr:hypothetical protein EVAR_60375_1 [Eumeta japonica]
MVTAAHGDSQLQRSHRCVAGLLGQAFDICLSGEQGGGVGVGIAVGRGRCHVTGDVGRQRPRYTPVQRGGLKIQIQLSEVKSDTCDVGARQNTPPVVRNDVGTAARDVTQPDARRDALAQESGVQRQLSKWNRKLLLNCCRDAE